ncbi:hypothetical protein SCUCBS95973_001538 [Sporothrix curviconia]|uniref:FAD-binding domain-containing protein n=1 Tax=Sporothrix curviconia TaxID=1260050 RepID=A0ABP0AZD9_9PEZI
MSQEAQPSRPFTVAVAGAGIAGLALAIALKDLPGVRVDLYERAMQLREIGASIALGPNGMRSLERLGVHNALVDTADDPEQGLSFRNASGFPMVYRHYKTGEVVSTDRSQADRGIERRHWTARYYRAHLQEALAAHVDPQQIHLNKAFAGVAWDGAANHLVITFADGTTATADLLVGADGLHSRVRTFFEPSSRPVWTGALAFRSVFPRSHVAHINDLPHEATHVWGPDRTLFFSPLGRDLYTVVGQLQFDPDAPTQATVTEEGVQLQDTVSAWAAQGNVKTLRRLYATWGPLVQRLVAAVPHTQLYPNSSSHALPTWVLSSATVPAGRVTLVGDAAHAHGGAFATGGSLALDDAWSLGASLREVLVPVLPQNKAGPSTTADRRLLLALQIYEATRKAHTDRLLQVVHAANAARVARLRASQTHTAVPETDEQLRERIRTREDPTWLHEHDVTAVFANVVRERQGRAPTEVNLDVQSKL